MCKKRDVLKMQDVLEIINMGTGLLDTERKAYVTVDQVKDTDQDFIKIVQADKEIKYKRHVFYNVSMIITF